MTEVREPPHSDSLERAILACLLDGRDQSLVPLARSIIPHALVWWQRNHRIIWMMIEDLDNAGSAVTAVSIAEALGTLSWGAAIDRLSTLRSLQDAHHLDGMSKARIRAMFRKRESDVPREHDDSVLAEVGGFTALAELSAAYTTSSGFEENCRRLLGYYHRRQIITACHAVIDKTFTASDARESLECADGLLSRINPSTDDDSITEAGPVAIDIIESDAEAEDLGSWGIPKLDRLVPLDRNRNPIVAARPGVGKTSIAMQIARHTARQRGYAPGCVAFAGVEVGAKDMVQWLLAQSAGVSITQVSERTWDAAARGRGKQAAEAWGSAIVLNESNVATIEGLCAWAKNHKRTYGDNFHTLIVDHIHAMAGPDEEYVRISNISRRLMLLRKDLNICIVILAQLNRSPASGGKIRKPGLADLRGSGSLEQDATSVVFLHQDNPEGCVRHGEILVSKNRYGPCEGVLATYDASRGGTWSPPDPRAPDPFGVSQRYQQEPSPDEDLFS